MINSNGNTNILFITVDCFRYDQYETLNWLDSLPGGEINFNKCIATGPGTRTAFPGLLTSTFPLESGGYNVVGPDRTVIAEPLQNGGYATAGFHSNPNLGSHNGWDSGFETYYDSIEGKRQINQYLKQVFPEGLIDLFKDFYLSRINRDELPYKRAEEINVHVSDWIRDQDRPWFCWVHYMDLHHPYLPPEEYREANEQEARRLWRLLNDNENSLTDKDVEALWEFYRGEARYLADEINSLYDSLLSDGELDNTLVIFTGDHGEEFREHGTLAHKEKLYDELVHVPLVFSGNPVNKDTTVENIVSTLDVPVTIIEEFIHDDVKVPQSYRGRNLLASDYQRNGSFSEIAHTQFTDISAEQLVVSYRTDEWKYIINRQRDRTELYDLNTDPEETENLASSKPQIESELHNYIETHINKHIKDMGPGHDDVNPDIEERLSDLGYM